MAQRHLARLQVGASGDMMGCHRVPERMHRGTGDPRLAQVFGGHVLDCRVVIRVLNFVMNKPLCSTVGRTFR